MKKPPQKTARQREAEEKARTCQICGRPIFAELGLIAHHGYERPGEGWQTESCIGARELPFETSRDVLGNHIVALENALEVLEASRATCCADGFPLRVEWEGKEIKPGDEGYRVGRHSYHRHTITFLRETFDVVTRETTHALDFFHESYDARFTANVAGMTRGEFDFWKFRELLDYDRKIDRQRREIRRQRRRFAEWKKTEQWDNGEKKWKLAA
ncbi:MAG: hypothetical protein KGL39_04850 [Patescibacteria group bacterium]|nr:hypothetical protein [Patescibacteria group bacterium]